MSREFKNPDYEATLNSAITLREALPLNHLARFVVDVITQLDLSAIYTRYAPVGGVAFAPEILLGLLFYGYATGVFSSRKIERATYESIPFRFVASSLHPDHDTIAHLRKTFLIEIQELFVWLHPDGFIHCQRKRTKGSRQKRIRASGINVSTHDFLRMRETYLAIMLLGAETEWS